MTTDPAILAFEWVPALDGWIVAIGALAGAACAVPGVFLLLRRMSMMGDAIAHAVLPGIAIAFLVTGSRSSLPMFLGAAAVGVGTAVLTQWISGAGRVDRGAAMGVVFTSLFALGLVMIVRAADHVDLDPGCVLHGAIELAPLDLVPLAGFAVPRAALVAGAALLVNALAATLLFKELRLVAFDPALARTQGISPAAIHHLLMVLVAVTAVACFEAIGSILVIAMLVAPAATAHLLCDRLAPTVLVATAIGAIAAPIGHVGALLLADAAGISGVSTAGMIAVAAGGLFVAALLVAPRQGLVARLLHRLAVTRRILAEDLLGLLWRLEEARGRGASLETREVRAALDAGPLAVALARRDLRRAGRLEPAPRGAVRLAEPGRRAAAGLVRTHRLWEAWLHERLRLAPDHVHGTAHRVEHHTTESMRTRLERETRGAERDPHGRAVPRDDDDPASRDRA